MTEMQRSAINKDKLTDVNQQALQLVMQFIIFKTFIFNVLLQQIKNKIKTNKAFYK